MFFQNHSDLQSLGGGVKDLQVKHIITGIALRFRHCPLPRELKFNNFKMARENLTVVSGGKNERMRW